MPTVRRRIALGIMPPSNAIKLQIARAEQKRRARWCCEIVMSLWNIEAITGHVPRIIRTMKKWKIHNCQRTIVPLLILYQIYRTSFIYGERVFHRENVWNLRCVRLLYITHEAQAFNSKPSNWTFAWRFHDTNGYLSKSICRDKKTKDGIRCWRNRFRKIGILLT